jgi:hypothetical protein
MEPIAAEVVEDQRKQDSRGRKTIDAAQREQLLTAFEASGLSQRAYARREGINCHTFVAWRQRYGRGAKATGPVRFEELTLASRPKTAGLEVTLPGGLVVRGTRPADVAELVRALRT